MISATVLRHPVLCRFFDLQPHPKGNGHRVTAADTSYPAGQAGATAADVLADTLQQQQLEHLMMQLIIVFLEITQMQVGGHDDTIKQQCQGAGHNYKWVVDWS
jgi:hypothetical protein